MVDTDRLAVVQVRHTEDQWVGNKHVVDSGVERGHNFGKDSTAVHLCMCFVQFTSWR